MFRLSIDNQTIQNLFYMHFNTIKSLYLRKISLYCLLSTVVIASAVYYFSVQDINVKKSKEQIELTNELNTIKSDFQKILNSDITAAKSIAVYCSEYPDLSKFDLFAKAVLEKNKFSEVLQVNINGIIKKVYPLTGYENTIGINTNFDSLRRIEYNKSINDMSIYFAGPRKLRQGGIGILGKVPFKMKNDSFGVAVVLTQLQTILNLLETKNNKQKNFSYWIVKNLKNPDTSRYYLSNAKPSINSPVFYVAIPEGDWNLYISYGQGYTSPKVSWQIIGLGAIILLLVCIYIYKRTLAPYQLDLIIQQKTKDILNQEKYYRTLVEQSSDALVLLDDKGFVKSQTTSAEKILGYTLEEIQKIDGASILHPDYREKDQNDFYSLTTNKVSSYNTKHKILNKFGEYIWIESTYLNLLNDPIVQSIVLTYRDISHRVKLEESEAHMRYLLGERIKELSTIYKVNSFLQDDTLEETTLLQKIANIIPNGFQFPEICHTLIAYKNTTITTPNYLHSDCNLKTSSTLNNGISITITVNYNSTQNKKASCEFLKEEEDLLKSICENLKIHFDKKDQQHALIESEEKFKSAFEDSSVGMAMTALNGKFILVNQTLCKMLGYTKEELLELDVKSITYQEDLTESLDFMDRARQGKTFIYNTEKRYLRKNGEIIYGNLNVSLVKDANSKPKYLVSQVEDITNRKELEFKLKNSLDEREQVINDLMKRVNDLQQFSYIVSHNLRAPVANIQGLADLLLTDSLDQETFNFLSTNIKKSADNLDIIINDLNDILNIQKDKTETKLEIIFSEKIEKVRSMLQKVIKEKNAVIETDFSEVNSYFSIKSYFTSIFYNLISNGLKFNRPGEQPIIKIWSVKTEGEIELHFKDNGIGIDLEKNGKLIFGLYKKLNLKYEGRGIGLFMLKTQVDAINGTIEVKSKINEGSHFIIKLPLDKT